MNKYFIETPKLNTFIKNDNTYTKTRICMYNYNFDACHKGLLIEALRAAGYNEITITRVLLHLNTATTLIPLEQARRTFTEFEKH